MFPRGGSSSLRSICDLTTAYEMKLRQSPRSTRELLARSGIESLLLLELIPNQGPVTVTASPLDTAPVGEAAPLHRRGAG
jgi:hypothetical protein